MGWDRIGRVRDCAAVSGRLPLGLRGAACRGVCVVHAFQKKSTQGIKTPKREVDLIKNRLKRLKEDIAMKAEKLEVVRGSGNVFRVLRHENADVEQFKAILAAEIIKALDREGLSVRAAHSRTGTAAADFWRIRNADLGRFTSDRLMA